MALAETAKLTVALNLKDGLTGGIRNATRGLTNFDKGIGRAGKGVGQLGTGMARAGAWIGTAVVGGITAATVAAINFEDAFAGVRKTVDASEPQLQDLAQSFRKMATEIPIAATEFARIGELGGALGIPVDQLDEFTRTVALLGVTTDVAVDDAAMALGQLGNILNLTADDFDNFGATLVDLGNKGASTEGAILEITRRAGSSARLIDLAADATLGWSAAVANLGDAPELAGTALQMFFQRSLEITSKGGRGLELLGKTAGMTAKQFEKAFAKDSSAALQSFIGGLAKLPKDARLALIQKLFGKRTGLTRTILGLADSYDKNLVPALNNANTAWEANAALTEESRKRFDTIRSSVTLLRNNLIEAAMVFGEGVAPAIGRAAKKLSEFLKAPENRTLLKSLGEDIGKAIDGIDWKRLLDTAKGLAAALKPALALVIKLGELIASLPPGLVGAGAGLVVTNKLSGGLIGAGLGNIVGGVAESFAKSAVARIPILGKGFVQPVFVTNMGAGGLGGGGAGPIPPSGSTTGGITGALKQGAAVAGTVVVGTIAAEGAKQIGTSIAAEIGKNFGPQAGQVSQSTFDVQRGIAFGPFESIRRLPGDIETLAGAIGDLVGVSRTAPAKSDGASAAIIEEQRRTTGAVVSSRVASKQDSARELATEKMTAAAIRTGTGTTGAKLNSANARLAAIQRKKTSFTSITNVNIPITIRDIQNVQNKRRRIVKRNQLATI